MTKQGFKSFVETAIVFNIAYISNRHGHKNDTCITYENVY